MEAAELHHASSSFSSFLLLGLPLQQLLLHPREIDVELLPGEQPAALRVPGAGREEGRVLPGERDDFRLRGAGRAVGDLVELVVEIAEGVGHPLVELGVGELALVVLVDLLPLLPGGPLERVLHLGDLGTLLRGRNLRVELLHVIPGEPCLEPPLLSAALVLRLGGQEAGRLAVDRRDRVVGGCDGSGARSIFHTTVGQAEDVGDQVERHRDRVRRGRRRPVREAQPRERQRGVLARRQPFLVQHLVVLSPVLRRGA